MRPFPRVLLVSVVLVAVATVATAQLPQRGQTAPTGPTAPAPRPTWAPLPPPAAPAPTGPTGATGAPAPKAPAPTPLPAPAPAAPPVATPPPAVAPAPAAPVAAPAPAPAATARVSGSVNILQKDGSKKPGEGSIVYIETIDPSQWKRAATAPPPKLSMKDKQFAPRTVAVLAGKSVAFPNDDKVFHNAFSLSGANKFDLGLYKDGATKSQAFEQPGVVRVFCNIHPQMSASVLVLQNPYWAQVGADGAFSIADVPPGTWTLKVWHERGGEQQQPLVVAPGQKATASFELDASKFKVVPHKNKFGKDYDTEGY